VLADTAAHAPPRDDVYGYGVRTVWLDDLEPERSPAGYDLCTDHADGLGVPQGWERRDRRRQHGDRRGEATDRRRARRPQGRPRSAAVTRAG
jgi:hypothetical protein